MGNGGGDDEQARAVCEHALALISNAGDWTDLEGGSRIAHWSTPRFRVALLVPPDAGLEGACIPHVLEIWDGDGKVVSAFWDDPRQLETRLLVKGDWEAEFLVCDSLAVARNELGFSRPGGRE